MELFYFQVLRLGAFHADPHSGNYLFGSDGSIGLVDFGCVKRLTPEFVANLSGLYLYRGARGSAHFQSLLDKRYAMFGTTLRPAARRALIGLRGDVLSQGLSARGREGRRSPFDFGESTVLQDYLRESRKLMNSKGALSEHVLLARVEMGLYDTLHRLRARVHTSRIVRQFLKD